MEIWEALRLEDIKTNGRTQPLVVECIGPQPTGQKRCSFVVKALNRPETTQNSLGFEVIGNSLAHKLGVNTPTPALIQISEAFVEANSQRELGLVPGFGAGCEYLKPGFAPLTQIMSLNELEMSQARRIYAFDLLTQNPDRTLAGGGRPNCALFQRDLVAFDFEMCFSFIHSLSVVGEAWEVSKHGIYRNHIFYSALRREKKGWALDFSGFMTDLRALNIEEFVQNMRELPDNWIAYLTKIEAHLYEIVQNTDAFERELYRSLA